MGLLEAALGQRGLQTWFPETLGRPPVCLHTRRRIGKAGSP